MSTPPADLRSNPSARGPAGAELMGVTVALPLKEVTHDDGQPWSQQDWADAVRHYQPQMLEMLKVHVGGARPGTMPEVTVDGPHSDPLQGVLYVMTCAAWFYPATLPPDCPAYRARGAEARHG